LATVKAGGPKRCEEPECAPADDPAQNKRKESGSQPLEVDGGRCQVGLDLHIGEATADGAREPVPGLGFAVEAFRTPAMALVEPSILCAPLLATAAGAEQSGIIVTDNDCLVDPSLR